MKFSISRAFYTVSATKRPDIQLISRIRKDMEGLSISRVKEALLATDNDYDRAVTWLSEQLRIDGEKRAEKVQNRRATEGFVALAERPGLGSVLLEINCESDFVAQNGIFQQLSTRVASSALLFQDFQRDDYSSILASVDLKALLEKPLLPEPASLDFEKSLLLTQSSETVEHGITDTIGKLGENIKLRRAVFASPSSSVAKEAGIYATCFMGSFLHGAKAQHQMSPDSNLRVRLGKSGAVVLLECTSKSGKILENPSLKQEFSKLSTKIAQHIVGMNPSAVAECLEQPFLFQQEKLVKEVLFEKAKDLNLETMSLSTFTRFACGEEIAGEA